MFDPVRIAKNFRVIAVEDEHLRGWCFAPFSGLNISQIRWRTHLIEGNPNYRIEKLTHSRRVVSTLWPGNDMLPLEQPIRLYIKRAWVTSSLRAAGSLLRTSKAKREFDLGIQLFEKGIPASLPVWCGENREHGFLRESFLVTLGLEGALPFPAAIRKLAQAEQRRNALCQLGMFLRQALERGFQHVDCSAKHVFVEGDPSNPEAHQRMAFIDVDGGRLDAPFTPRTCRKIAFQVFRSLEDEPWFAHDEQIAFLGSLYGTSIKEAQMEQLVQQFCRMEERLRLRKRLFQMIGVAR